MNFSDSTTIHYLSMRKQRFDVAAMLAGSNKRDALQADLTVLYIHILTPANLFSQLIQLSLF